MYRPAPPPSAPSALSGAFFGQKNSQTLYTVLSQEFEEKQVLEPVHRERLLKTLTHYQQEVFQKCGGEESVKGLAGLNREVLTACHNDFRHYLERKIVGKVRGSSAVQQVMTTGPEDGLFQGTAQRFEQMNKERQGVKALPPPAPDFRISLSEDGPPAAELFERAKRLREQEALRSAATATAAANAVASADVGLQQRIQADSLFRSQQNSQNRASEEMALVQRGTSALSSSSMGGMVGTMDTSLVVLPDRREMLMTPIGSFDGHHGSGQGQGQGQGQIQNHAAGNTTLAVPFVGTEDKTRLLPQSVLTKEEPVVQYREVESNLY